MLVRIVEDVWSLGSDLRRAEWRTLIEDWIDEGPIFPGQTPLDGVSLGPSHITVLSLRTTRTLWSPAMDTHAAEYLRTIRLLMDESSHSSKFAALDMAKKVVHDNAGRALATLAPDVHDAHECYRRLFSLLVALRVDTTKLPTAHGHGARSGLNRRR